MGIDIALERERQEAAEKKARLKKEYYESVDREIARDRAIYSAKGGWICTSCGTVGKRKTITKGSILVELAAWTFGILFAWFFLLSLLVPIIYSVWRHLSRFKGCPKCQATMIGVDTPVGKDMLGKIKDSLKIGDQVAAK